MVALTAVRECNTCAASDERMVCVCAGATSGIGAGTLSRLVQLRPNSTFYVIGRSAARFAAFQQQDLIGSIQSQNGSGKVVFLEAEFSVLAQVDDVCRKISGIENRVDWLYMSPGMIPLNGAQFTSEGLETCFALSYYSRARLLTNLLPLLNRSRRPKVLNVLNGGKEQPLLEDDLGLEHNWSAIRVVNHSTTMTSLLLDHLSAQNPEIAFIHAQPGWVHTDNFARLSDGDHGLVWDLVVRGIQSVVTVLVTIFGISTSEAGERQAFHLTSGLFGPGTWLVDHHSEDVAPNLVMKQGRQQSLPGKVWSHTDGFFTKHTGHARLRTPADQTWTRGEPL
ncbi:hypothetical protein BJY00DRAFT_315031 [Aspergillus carlsbadensis]|nr:hypothetical protein BJY00DRAFT_315031 [Aspergillus carlsbadensis]